MNGIVPYFIWLLAILVVLTLVMFLAERQDRRLIIKLMFIGFVLSSLKFFLISLFPQHGDLPVDSLVYKLNAQAIYMHQNGAAVDPYAYKLNGFLNYHLTSAAQEWGAKDVLSYSDVIGSYEWLYPFLLALHIYLGSQWQEWAMLTNLLLSSMMPAIVWLIAKEFGAPPVGRWLGAFAMALDPAVAVNSSWLLKDALATALMAFSILAYTQFYNNPRKRQLVILFVSLVGLSMVRFIGYVALVSSIMVVLFLGREIIKKRWLCSAVLLSVFVAFPVCYFAPQFEQSPVRVFDKTFSRIYAPVATIKANSTEKTFDPAVEAWSQRLESGLIQAALHSAVRTILAPYPWDLRPSRMTWVSHTELHALGSLLWFPVLPFVVMGFFIILKRRSFIDISIFLTIVLLVFAYTLTLGEWSTRQRAFMNPIFFAIFGLGVTKIVAVMVKDKAKDKFNPSGFFN